MHRTKSTFMTGVARLTAAFAPEYTGRRRAIEPLPAPVPPLAPSITPVMTGPAPAWASAPTEMQRTVHGSAVIA
jgi:hypothetical protein